MFGLIPAPYVMLARVLAGLALILGIMWVGDHLRGEFDDMKYGKEISVLKTSFQARIDEAATAEKAADDRARNAILQAQIDLGAADTKHQKEITDEHAKTQAAVADATAGRIQLRFYADAAANPGRGSPVPGAPAAASSGDGRTIAQLPAAVAGSLLTLTGEVDDTLIPQIHLLQDTVNAYYKECGPKGPTMAVAPVGGGLPAGIGATTAQPPTAPQGRLPASAGSTSSETR